MPDDSTIRSYTSASGPTAWLREARQLLLKTRQSSNRLDQETRRLVGQCRAVESIINEQTGTALEGLDALEIGIGQLPRQAAYFAARSRVTAIDLDVVPRGFDPTAYWGLLRRNGIQRLLKTIGRKAIGYDRAFRRSLARELGVGRLPPFAILQMDAAAMSFGDASFDFVYSFDVFEHLPDPAAVLREVRRVLKPGGVAAAYIHLYTCDSGHHDLRLYLPDRGHLPYWAHLRPAHQSTVQSFTHLNKLRLSDWKAVIESEWSGATLTPFTVETTDDVRGALRDLRTKDELHDYTDEELLTDRIIAVWKK